MKVIELLNVITGEAARCADPVVLFNSEVKLQIGERVYSADFADVHPVPVEGMDREWFVIMAEDSYEPNDRVPLVSLDR